MSGAFLITENAENAEDAEGFSIELNVSKIYVNMDMIN